MQQIKIDVIDNGFILSYVKQSALGHAPEYIVKYLSTIQEVTEILNKEF